MTVCIDIGGSTSRLGFSNNKRKFDKIIRFTTFDNFQDQINRIIFEIKSQSLDISKINIAAAGSLDKKKGIFIKWGQKKLWRGQNIFQPLFQAFPKTSFLLENDANVAALGEAVYGAGRNYSLVGYLTLSSGIGGCLIINKKITPHHFGIEPAHQIINFYETKVWSCGQRGCFESYASGTAFKQIFGITAEECDDKNIWKAYSKLVAVGLANLIVLWSPEIMVIGGGVANKFEQFISPLKLELKKLLPIFNTPLILKSKLNDAGLYGWFAFK